MLSKNLPRLGNSCRSCSLGLDHCRRMYYTKSMMDTSNFDEVGDLRDELLTFEESFDEVYKWANQ